VNERRALLKHAMDTAAGEEVVADASPDAALQEVLDRTLTWFRLVKAKVDELDESQLWVQGDLVERLNKWANLERSLRYELAQIAGGMVKLNIDGRRAKAAEIFAEAIAPVLQGVLEELKLTPAQQKRAPELVARHLQLVEGS
jgi:hypothetical protein